LLFIDGKLSFKNEVVSEPVRLADVTWPEGSPELLRDRQFAIQLIAPLSNAAIGFIEENRGGNDLDFQLELQYRWQEALKSAPGSCAGKVHWASPSLAQFRSVARSSWLKHLAEMQWCESELFEVARGAIGSHQDLSEALSRLNQAQASFRNGDWNGVLLHCRLAMEGTAKVHAKSDDVKRGYEILLNLAMPEHEAKRAALDTLIHALTDYCHLGRHEKYPALQITRSEAEFVYTATLGLFSLLGRRLAGQETIATPSGGSNT